jgi:hypothetical protein
MGKDGDQGYDKSCREAEQEFDKWTYTDLALGTWGNVSAWFLECGPW